jgi:hypothetical protein
MVDSCFILNVCCTPAFSAGTGMCLSDGRVYHLLRLPWSQSLIFALHILTSSSRFLEEGIDVMVGVTYEKRNSKQGG